MPQIRCCVDSCKRLELLIKQKKINSKHALALRESQTKTNNARNQVAWLRRRILLISFLKIRYQKHYLFDVIIKSIIGSLIPFGLFIRHSINNELGFVLNQVQCFILIAILWRCWLFWRCWTSFFFFFYFSRITV